MPDYNFHTLSPIDFENLVRDLLQSELSIRLECVSGVRHSMCQWGQASKMARVNAKCIQSAAFDISDI